MPEEERLKAAGLEGFFMRVECAAERWKVLMLLMEVAMEMLLLLQPWMSLRLQR